MYFSVFSKNAVNSADCVDQSIHISLFSGNNFFPVPLVNKYRVDIVSLLITSYGIHICVDALAEREAVFL